MNIAEISQATTTAVGLSNLILVSPQKTVGYQPQNAPSWKQDSGAQGAAILFNYEGEQTASITSDITDHFIEDNTAVQDQISLKPVTITTHGFIGELNDIPPAALKAIKVVADKLTTIGAYAPSLSVTAQLAYVNAFQLYQVGANLVNTAVSSWATINGGANPGVINGSTTQSSLSDQRNKSQTEQQIYFQQFYGAWQNRTLFTVQTPWAIFQDMAIVSLRAVQDAETRMISDFEITFKQLRFASTITIAAVAQYDPNAFQSRLANQGSSEVNLGTNVLQKDSSTFTSVAFPGSTTA